MSATAGIPTDRIGATKYGSPHRAFWPEECTGGGNAPGRRLSVDSGVFNPDLMADQRIVLEKDTVHILRTMFLWRGTAYQRLCVRNYGDRAVDLQLSILFENDFADLFEVRGTHRERRRQYGVRTAESRECQRLGRQASVLPDTFQDFSRIHDVLHDPAPCALHGAALH